MILTWENETGDSSYEVEIPQISFIGTTSISQYEISGLNAGTNYEVSVFLKSFNHSRMHLFTANHITGIEMQVIKVILIC